jgi:hypothetical protein
MFVSSDTMARHRLVRSAAILAVVGSLGLLAACSNQPQPQPQPAPEAAPPPPAPPPPAPPPEVPPARG